MRFKDLRKKIDEAMLPTDYYGGYVVGTRVGPLDSQDNAVDAPEASVHKLTHQELRRLNTFLGASEDKDYIDPNVAINNMKQKLQSQGISFDFKPDDIMEDGDHIYPLKQFGGRYGMVGTSYDPIKDDGISHRLGHGLDLVISIARKTNGLTTMCAKIVPSNGQMTTPEYKPKNVPMNMSASMGAANKQPFTNPTFAKQPIGQ